MHLEIHDRALEIRVINVSVNSVGDPPMLPELLAQIASVTEWVAYAQKLAKLLLQLSGRRPSFLPRRNTLRMLIPAMKSRALPAPGPSYVEEMERLSLAQLGRNQDRCLKLLSKLIMSRDFDR